MPRAIKFLLTSSFLFASHAFAISLPTSSFSCGLYTAPFFGPTLLSDCTVNGSATPGTPGMDIVGVNLGMGDPVVWEVKGSNAGGTQIAIPGAVENQGGTLLLQTIGTVGGTGSFTGYMPLHYDFTITTKTPVSCVSSDPCGMDISWTLGFLLQGPAVKGGELALPIVEGSGTGTFTGDLLLPSSPNPLISALPMTLIGGETITVTGYLALNASNFPNDASASFEVIVPGAGSFDFQSANSAVPEPGTVVLGAAGLLALAYRRFTSRA